MGKKHNPKKEKFVMLASSVLVLSALTLTGVYVKERTRIQNENSAQLSVTEEATEENQSSESNAPVIVGSAVNPNTKEDALESDFGSYESRLAEMARINAQAEAEKDLNEDSDSKEDASGEESSSAEAATETAANQPALAFSESEGLVWPIVGKVLINYSMDKTVYFETLQQYKYNPALMIQATEGENIAAAADGRVSSVFYDAQYGNCISVDLGNGYELTYGQLGNVALKEGDYMQVGDIIGTVASPTKYFAVEGANVYFKLTLNGEPCDPLNRMS